MKTTAVCPVCIEEEIAGGSKPTFQPLVGELDDVGYIHVTCEKGHYGVVIYNARRYEVLVRSAAKAFVDGHTNEVIAVMSAALERAYEFYVRVSCRAKGIAPEMIEAAWKGVASQSERQFGAFQFLHLIDDGNVFKLDKTITETRNNVIHKGRIAREAEAGNFAENVFKHIKKVEESIRVKFPQHAVEQADQEVALQKSLVPEGTTSITLKMHTVLVDPKKGEVIGMAGNFAELAGAIVQSRSRRFPD